MKGTYQMYMRPNEHDVIQTYSLSELLELVKAKAVQKSEERLLEAHKHVEALNQMLGGQTPNFLAPAPVVSRPSAPASRRGRPPKKTEKASVPSGVRRGRPPRGSMSLKDYLLKVLNSKPMEVKEIMERLEKLGYRSNAQDPRRVLYLELKKLVVRGDAARTERGMYKAR